MQAGGSSQRNMEAGPVFINLPTSGTSRAVCSWPNAAAVLPAEMESERISEVLAGLRPR